MAAFDRTDPELDTPVGGVVEVGYDLAHWSFTPGSGAGPPWTVRASIVGRFDVALRGTSVVGLRLRSSQLDRVRVTVDAAAEVEPEPEVEPELEVE